MMDVRILISNVCAWRAKLPLQKPYHLSFGTVNELDSILVRVEAGKVSGWGESTPLPGYSEENADRVWEFVSHFAGRLPGLSLEEAIRMVGCAPLPGFSRISLMAALEEVRWLSGPDPLGQKYWGETEGQEIPLAAIIDLTDFKESEKAGVQALADGYETVKTKVALPPVNPDRDAEKCVALREALGRNVRIRVDANQGYSLIQARRFIEKVQPAELELLEQPLSVDMWKEMIELHADRGNVSLMLDESIASLEDISRCTDTNCADMIKLKLMKQGGLSDCLLFAEKAKKAGLSVVIGNGVQSGLGCMQEARLHWLIDAGLAGEENGFLKPERDILWPTISVLQGKIRIERKEVNSVFLEKIALNKKEFLI